MNGPMNSFILKKELGLKLLSSCQAGGSGSQPGDDGLHGKIIQLEIHRHPLTSIQLTSLLWYHAFVVLQTQGGKWWSIERNVKIFLYRLIHIIKLNEIDFFPHNFQTEGLSIHGSNDKTCVLDYYRQQVQLTIHILIIIESYYLTMTY